MASNICHALISGNTITNNGRFGIELVDCTGEVRGNTVSGSGKKTPVSFSQGAEDDVVLSADNKLS